MNYSVFIRIANGSLVDTQPARLKNENRAVLLPTRRGSQFSEKKITPLLAPPAMRRVGVYPHKNKKDDLYDPL